MNTLSQHPVITNKAGLLKRAPRLDYIDGLRGLAMLMVLVFHCWGHSGMWRIDLPIGHHRINLASPIGVGYTGVHLFLVLSGFCLYWPFVKAGSRYEPSLLEFAKRRCRRILPPYYAALVLFGGSALLQALTHHGGYSAGYLAEWFGLHALMLHNLFPDHILAIDPPLWSLALEFQLYILFPVFMEAFRRVRPPAVVIGALFGCLVFRYFATRGLDLSGVPDSTESVLLNSVFSRCFEFGLGMLAARIVAGWHKGERFGRLLAEYGIVAAVVAVAMIVDHKMLHSSVTSDAKWGIFYAGIVLIGSRVSGIIHRLLSAKWLAACGVFSYSVYLIHEPLVAAAGGWLLRRHLSAGATISIEILAVVPAALLLGYLFHWIFERPFLNQPRVLSYASDSTSGGRRLSAV